MLNVHCQLTGRSYNAALFQIATFNEYNINTIDARSEAYTALNTSSFSNESYTAEYRKLRGSQWLGFYNTKYVLDYGDLYLAIDRVAFDTPQHDVVISTSDYLPLEVKSGNLSVIRQITAEAGPWVDYKAFAQWATPQALTNATWPSSVRVTESFSRIIEPHSRILMSRDFMIVVVSFNALKLAIMVWVLMTDKSEYIVTLGDAVASFLSHSDPCTYNQCMLSKDEMLWTFGSRPYHIPEDEEMDKLQLRLNGVWLPSSLRYFVSLTADRQVFFALL